MRKSRRKPPDYRVFSLFELYQQEMNIKKKKKVQKIERKEFPSYLS